MRHNKKKALLSVVCLLSLIFACASCMPQPAAPSAAGNTPGPSASMVPGNSPDGYAFFDDAVFIGDCITIRLKNYVTEKRLKEKDYMGTAQFLTAAGLGSANALKSPGPDSKHPTYKGEKMSIEDGVLKSGAKKAYIMLGTSDLHTYGTKEAAEFFATLVGRIEAKVPGVKVYVQSVTPVIKATETKMLNNETINLFNDKLRALCKKKGYVYIDVASVLRDDKGYLAEEYTSDEESHPNEVFCSIWIDYLLSHTA